MSALSRYTQKVFGSTASANSLSQFGSFAAGTPVRYSGATVTPAVVQNLSNFLTGWKGAVVGNNSLLIEDMNSLCYLFSYQVAYLMQQGIAEWDASTTYFIGSLVNSGGILYSSRTNNNLNNALTDATSWSQPVQKGLLTEDATSGNILVATGQSLMWPNLSITSGNTVTVQTGAHLISFDTITILGTGTLLLEGTAVGQII